MKFLRVPQRTIQIPIASDARHTQPTRAKHAALLGVACGYGQHRRGVEDGPASIRSAGLGSELRDLGYEVLEREDVKASSPTPDETNRRPRNVRSVLEACRLQSDAMTQAFADGTMPVTLGGDHSLSLGSWRAIQQRGHRTGLLWVDAHGDFNTPETSPSGNIHGMILSAIAGIGQNALTTFLDGVPRTRTEDIVLLGVRSLDQKERLLVRDAGVTCFTMKDIDTRGIIPVMEDALDVLTRGGQPFHVSFDVDAVDPAHAPGTGTPTPGGLTYRESRLLMEMVFERGGMSSLDFSEVNPWLDRDGITSRLAVELIASACGRAIL